MPDWAFELVARVAAKPTDIKAGSYELRAGATPLDLLGKLMRGEFAVADVKLIEGWTFRQVVPRWTDMRGFATTPRDCRMRRSSATRAAARASEGWFFPDTYVFPRGTSDLEILRQAYRAMEKTSWCRLG